LLRENQNCQQSCTVDRCAGIGRSLPGSLSETEVELLLQAPNTIHALGFRDRTMLELLYATGLRVSELVELTFQQV